MTFAVAINKFFGRKDGQTVRDFALEISRLTDADRAEMAPLLSKELGVEVDVR